MNGVTSHTVSVVVLADLALSSDFNRIYQESTGGPHCTLNTFNCFNCIMAPLGLHRGNLSSIYTMHQTV